jgi:hypothetical protein
MMVSVVILIATTTLLFSYRFYGVGLLKFENLIVPKSPVGVLATTIAGGVLMYFISSTVALLVVVLKKPRALGLASFLPFVLSYGLGMAGLISTGGSIHFSPFNIILVLNYHYYANATLVLDEPVTSMWRSAMEGTGQVLEPGALWLALLGWIVLFTLIPIALFKKQKGVSLEQIVSG